MGNNAVFWHRGQRVTGATATVVSLAEAVGLRSWKDNDRVCISDGAGYKVESQINDAGIESTDTTITVDSQAALANVGVGATLNGTTQYFDGGNVLNVAANDFSISAWVKRNGNPSTAEIIVDKGDTTTAAINRYVLYIDTTGKIGAAIAKSAYVSGLSNSTVTDNKWHHIAVTYDRDGNATFYKDGYADGTLDISAEAGDLTDNGNFRIGYKSPSGSSLTYFNGSIRDVRIQIGGTLPTAAQILYQATNPLDYSASSWTLDGTRDYWTFTDAAASATIAGATNALSLVGGTTTNYGTHSRTQTAFISKNLIADAGMENGGIGGITTLNAITDGTLTLATIEKNTTTVKKDTRVLKIIKPSNGTYLYLRGDDITIGGDENYLFNGWLYADTATQLYLLGDDGFSMDTISGTSGEWKYVESAIKTTSSQTYLRPTFAVTSSSTGYWDDIQLLPNLADNGGIEATGAEILAETNFATHAEWDVTGVADDSGGNVAFVFAGGTLNGTVQQIAADRVSTGTNSALYKFTYTIAVTTAPDGDFALTLDNFPDASTTLDFTAGTKTVYFWSASDATSQPLTITTAETTSTQGSFTIDNVTLKEVQSWTKEGTPTTAECNVSASADHSGTLGIELTNADDGEGVTQDVTVVNGKYYTFSAWAKNNSQDTEILLSGATTKTIDTTNANAWTKYSYTFKAASTTLTIKLVSGAADQDGYFDDVAVIQPDQIDASTATPTTAANSFEDGKWNGLEGSFQDDGLDTITFASSEVPTNRGTILGWFNIQSPYDTGDDKVLFDVRGADDNNRIKIYYQASSDKFAAYINGGDRVLSSAETDNTNFYTWIFVALTYNFDNDSYALYVNGIQVDTDTTSLTAPTLSGNAFVGSDYNSTSQGDIMVDEFRIYDFSMTARQIKTLYYEIKPTWR